MAGIGFELKKLFAGKGLLQNMRACFFSIIITIGPTLLCILLLTVLQNLLGYWGADVADRELFMAAIIYSFLFSLILTSGFNMILSRYISDKIYMKQYQYIIASQKGAVALCLLIGGIAGIIFYYRSPLELRFKLPAYMLFMELNILWLQTVYISALRDYMKLIRGFCGGVSSAFLLSCILVMPLGFEPLSGVLISVVAGFFIIILVLQYSIESFFPKGESLYFSFLEYIDQYPALFFIGLLYTLGLYIHNFYFWSGDLGVILGGTYIFAPEYDIPTFWAFLTILPTMVIFIVSCETSFYEKYKAYYDAICSGGLVDEIFRLQDEMREVMSHNLRNIMCIQMIFTILSLAIGMLFLPLTGLQDTYIDIFNVLVIGNYAFIFMFICLTVLLYFDDRKGALLVVCFFAPANIYLTGITASMGNDYYGSGFMAAAFLSLIIAFLRLNYLFNNIRYYTFCSQPILKRNRTGIFTRIALKLQVLLSKCKQNGI